MGLITKQGKTYDAGDITITMLGNIPNEVYAISYDSKQKFQRNYRLGSNDASSWSAGEVEHNGSIELSMADSTAIENAASKLGLNLVTKIPPFDIIVRYFNEYNLLVQDLLTCKFASTGRKVGQGELALRYSYELFVLNIIYNKPLA